jgi:uncharacterized membrane protein YgdD (TMEM256/DUF423 family)
MTAAVLHLRRAAGALAPARIRRGIRERRTAIEGTVATAAFLAGLALVAFGVALIYLPAGLIVGGVELAAGAALFARGGES